MKEEQTKAEMWKEIVALVQATHFTETDKKLFIKLIEEYSLNDL